MENSERVPHRQVTKRTGFERQQPRQKLASLGIVRLDARKHAFPISYCSDNFERSTGYSQQELLGEELRFLHGPETCDKAFKMLTWLCRNQQSGTVYLYSYFNDGLPLPTKLQVTPLKEAGGQVRAVAIEFSMDPWGLAPERLAA